MSRRMKFRNPAELHAAYARLVDQAWVDACSIDVPRLEMRVHVAGGETQRQRAEAWIARERRQRRRGSPARD
jgi:hypothetical protein